jgi:outer membrane protein assembly factor BamA
MYRVEPALYQEFGKRSVISVGPVFSHTVSNEERPTLALEQRPYGFGSFTEIGGAATILVDLRDDPVYPMLGVRAEAGGRFFPAVADVQESFGVVSGEVAGYLGTRKIPGSPVLAARVGGAKGLGDPPFFEAPALGGKSSLRGFSRERFNGDGSLYGSAELRLNLGQFKAVVPGEIGVYGLGDIGRVYRTGETSTIWHKTYGAGLWLSIYDRSLTINLTWGHSVERDKFYLAGGFHF